MLAGEGVFILCVSIGEGVVEDLVKKGFPVHVGVGDRDEGTCKVPS